MFIAYSKFKNTKIGGQIATVLTFVIAIILLLTVVVINIGKEVHKRNMSSIAVDGAAIAVASSLSSWAAYLRNQNDGQIEREVLDYDRIINTIMGIIVVVVGIVGVIASGGSSASMVYAGLGMIFAGASQPLYDYNRQATIERLNKDFREMGPMALPEAGIFYALMRAADDPAVVEDVDDLNSDGSTTDKMPRPMQFYLRRSKAIVEKYGLKKIIEDFKIPLDKFYRDILMFRQQKINTEYCIDLLYKNIPDLNFSFAPRLPAEEYAAPARIIDDAYLQWLTDKLNDFIFWYTWKFMGIVDEDGPINPDTGQRPFLAADPIKNWESWYQDLYITSANIQPNIYERAWYYKLNALLHEANAPMDKKGWLESLDQMIQEMNEQSTLIPDDLVVQWDGSPVNLKTWLGLEIENIKQFKEMVINFRNEIMVLNNFLIQALEQDILEDGKPIYEKTENCGLSRLNYRWTDSRGEHRIVIIIEIYPGLPNLEASADGYYTKYIIENPDGNVNVTLDRYDYLSGQQIPSANQEKIAPFWQIFKESKAQHYHFQGVPEEGIPEEEMPQTSHNFCRANWSWRLGAGKGYDTGLGIVSVEAERPLPGQGQ